MSQTIAKQSTEADTAENIKDPRLGWMIGFLFIVSFLGLFSLVPLRKIMIIDYKLIYPSGTATAYLINGFHTPQGAKLAKKQVKILGKFFGYSFLWGFFQWFYTAGDNCGFVYFPTLGLEAFKNKFYFDFSATYVGVGMICPYIVNISVLVGGILSWGIMWPLIGNQKGHWYPATVSDKSLHGLQGYRVFIGIAMILGDGLYNFIKVLGRTVIAISAQVRSNGASTLPVSDDGQPNSTPHGVVSFDDKRRTELFLKDQIPPSVAFAGYVVLALLQGFCRLGSTRVRVSRFIPLPMAMAIPFYLGSYFAIDMCVGSLVLFVWERINKAKADAFGPAVASGLICGDGIWTLPQSVLALAKVKPPICMKFLSRRTNVKVDAFLSG